MIFSSPQFLIFFVIVAIIHWYLIPGLVTEQRRLFAHHLFLLLASYFFYMSWDWRFGFLIAFSTLIDYGAGLFLEKFDSPLFTNRRRFLLLTSLGVNLGILAYFKYTNFFITSFVDLINGFAPGTYSETEQKSLLLDIILPLGISFFTFQSMSYTIDVYRRVIPTEKSLLKFALYVSFFPQLVAGPIVVAKDFLPQLKELPVFDLNRIREATRWFTLGYFKKVVLADNMAPVVDTIFGSPEKFDMAGHWLGALGFWVQVYGDFSGYSDMAWGAAIFLGYHLPENFRLPYLSRSPAEHWQRWHISLIKWIRDYLYIPLGGNRVGFLRHKYNVFLTMFLAGVWHGASWTFVVWGAIHGALLTAQTVFNEMVSRFKKTRTKTGVTSGANHSSSLATPFFILATSFCTIYFGTLFRSNSIEQAWHMLQSMVGLNDFAVPLPGVSLYRPVALGVLCIIAGHLIGYYLFEKKWRPTVPAWLEVALLPLMITLFIQLDAGDVTPFIYFVF